VWTGIPERLESGPPAGQSHQERVAKRRGDRSFAGILVGVNGEEHGWQAVAQALEVARGEQGRLLGLHVVPAGGEDALGQADDLQAAFERRCAEAGVQGKLVIDAGKVHQKICEWAWWSDLVVLSLAHPPGARVLSRLRSRFSILLQQCPRPVLTVPGAPVPLQRALLAYDDSPKAQEALFVAAYLARSWNVSLVVLTVLEDGETTAETLDDARAYLGARGVQATFIQRQGTPAQLILEQARVDDVDVIMMGGYGQHPLVSVVQGSTVERVLRDAQRPLLITQGALFKAPAQFIGRNRDKAEADPGPDQTAANRGARAARVASNQHLTPPG
jgi:nucleotide-binding universal stress UspA family protein